MKSIAIVAFALALTSCAAFTAESDFYVDNQSSYQMKVTWVKLDNHDSAEAIIPSGQKVRIVHAKMLEADKLWPSDYFESMYVYFGPGDTPVIQRAWTDNTEWNEESPSSGTDVFTGPVKY